MELQGIDQILTVLTKYYAPLAAVLWTLDKIAKATPWKCDDFVVDVLFEGLKRLVGRKPADE